MTSPWRHYLSCRSLIELIILSPGADTCDITSNSMTTWAESQINIGEILGTLLFPVCATVFSVNSFSRWKEEYAYFSKLPN